jgi:hypothetical protein
MGCRYRPRFFCAYENGYSGYLSRIFIMFISVLTKYSCYYLVPSIGLYFSECLLC